MSNGIGDYYINVLMPAYAAISKMKRAGMPISIERAMDQDEAWEKELLRLQEYVQSEASKFDINLLYSEAHAPKEKPLHQFLYHHPTGLGLNPTDKAVVRGPGKIKMTESGARASFDDEALMPYAAIGPNHREDDHPVVYAILKIRSIAKAKGTHLGGLMKWRRSDGCVHPKYKWILPNTTRLSASDPPVHQLPERADPENAKAIKACIVPRIKPWLEDPNDWDPRIHGWVARADVKGAEAVIRAGCIARCRVSVPYLRTGGDIHSKTASILYAVVEDTYKKGTPERDSVGKQSYFLLIFGGSYRGLQRTMWKKARMWWEEEESKGYHSRFFSGYPDLGEQYERDTMLMFSRGYVEDFYGRRWTIPPPPGMFSHTDGTGIRHFRFGGITDKETLRQAYKTFENRRHIYANRGTQTSQASTTLWAIALCILGEYVELQTPECLGGYNIFPETAGWALNEGPGPGGKPFQVWANNTVHDSMYADGAPGYLEPFAKLVTRRFNGVPAYFLMENDMPWRIDLEVGPDMANLKPYNVVAKQFGLEPLPER